MNKKISVDSLKENIQVYMRLEKDNENGWGWLYSCALDDFLKSEDVTLAYVNQMTKDEFDVMISLSSDIVAKLKSVELANAFINIYKKYYGQGLEDNYLYQNEIQPLFDFIQKNMSE